jgi:hypothetical protein
MNIFTKYAWIDPEVNHVYMNIHVDIYNPLIINDLWQIY